MKSTALARRYGRFRLADVGRAERRFMHRHPLVGGAVVGVVVGNVVGGLGGLAAPIVGAVAGMVAAHEASSASDREGGAG